MHGPRTTRHRMAQCPECEHTFTVSERVGIRRFSAPLERCPKCEHVTQRGKFYDAYAANVRNNTNRD